MIIAVKNVILCIVAGGVVLATGTPALAAPKDPLAALRAQLAPGKGVTLKQRTVGKSVSTLARSGRVQFDRRGIAASDLTAKLNVSGGDDDEQDGDGQAAALTKPERTLRVGRTSYIKGGPLGAALPDGKTWFRQSPGWTCGMTAMFGDFVNAAEPSTLKALLSRSARKGTTYTGSMSVKDLRRVSAWTRDTVWWELAPGVKVHWTLVVSPSGLPRTLTTKLAGAKVGMSSTGTKTTYSGWGARVSVKAPPKSAVTTKLDPEKGSLRLPPAPKR
jgi:hypothetical protein